MKRSKGSQDGAQPITGDELRAIKRYLAIRKSSLPWLFVTERGEQFTRQGIAYIIREAGTRAKLGRVWPHMLRHSCGYHLAKLSRVPDLRLIQDYLGHKNIKNTARYTRTSARRFEGLWGQTYRSPGYKSVGPFSPREGELAAFKAERDDVLQLRPLGRVELCLFGGSSGF